MRVELFVARVGGFEHVFAADRTVAVEDGLVVELKHAVDVGRPVIEREGLVLLGAELGLFEEDDDEAVEGVDLVGVEVVFSDYDIVLAHTRAAVGSQAHVGLVGLCAFEDKLGSGVARYGEEELVLHFSEEVLRLLSAALVVAAEGEELAHFLVEAFLGGADLADALEELVEVVPMLGIFEALVVHDEAFGDEFAQVGIGPAAELCAARRLYAEADGEDRFEIVVGNVVGFAVGGSCPEIPDN